MRHCVCHASSARNAAESQRFRSRCHLIAVSLDPRSSARSRDIPRSSPLVAYVIDVVSKTLAVARLTEGYTVELVGDLLTLHLVRNPGAAFSTGTRFTVALTVVAIVATCAVLYFGWRVRSRVWAVALGLLLAGVVGNLTDRLLRAPGPFRGHVVDFLQLPHWPVFNFADICINVAAGLILLQAFRGVRLDGTRDVRPSDSAPTRGGGSAMSSSSDQRTVLIPEGLAGERVDVAMARMFGLSRSRSGELIGQSLVHLDGESVVKSDRVHEGSLLEVTIPTLVDPLAVVPDIGGRHQHPLRR